MIVLPAPTTSEGLISATGRFDDMTSFFRISGREGERWVKEHRISFWRAGRHRIFGEEAVIDYWVAHYTAADGAAAEQARECARCQWREHLQLRQEANALEEVGKLRAEVEKLKRMVKAKEVAA